MGDDRSRDVETLLNVAAVLGAIEANVPPDLQVFEKLREIDKASPPIPFQAMLPAIRSAIATYIWALAESVEDELGKQHTFASGAMYGFQVAHDYVKKYGALW